MPIFTNNNTRRSILNYGQNTEQDIQFPMSPYQYNRLLDKSPKPGDVINLIHNGTPTLYRIVSLGGRQAYQHLVALYGEMDVPMMYRGCVIHIRMAEPL